MRGTPIPRCLVVALLYVAAAGCGGEAPGEEQLAAGTTNQSAPGLREYRASCALCHGANGEGHPQLGKDLRRNEFVRVRSDAELVEFLEQGRSASHPDNERGVEMPPRGGNPSMTDAELAAIVSYLRSIQ